MSDLHARILSPSGEGGAHGRRPWEGEGRSVRVCQPCKRLRRGEKPLTARFARTLSRGRGLLGACSAKGNTP